MASEGELKVVQVSKENIIPKKKIGRKECQLTTFDLPYLAFYYNQKLLFYKVEDGASMVAKLKQGLGEVLEEYYQLAGRLGRYEDGAFMVYYDDDLDGVEVVEAVAHDVTISDLTTGDSPLDLKKMVPYNRVVNVEGLRRPLLAVQLTRVNDGVVIGCAFNHAILDGTSTWHFMSGWANVCSGKPEGARETPFLDRTKARSTRVKLDLSIDQPVGQDGAFGSPILREKVFKFPGQVIEEIKSTVNANLPTGGKAFSTFQSFCAHIWRAVTRARRLKPGDLTVFTFFTDCRRRLDPPMPENYFGNLIQAVFSGTAAGVVMGSPLEAVAGIIQKAVDAHDANAIDARNAAWESNPVIFEYKDAGMNCVAVGSSPRFKVYGVDFGWGAPESVRSGSNNRFDGMVYLYQGKNGGGSIDVEVSLEVEAMARLEKDEEFLLHLDG